MSKRQIPYSINEKERDRNVVEYVIEQNDAFISIAGDEYIEIDQAGYRIYRFKEVMVAGVDKRTKKLIEDRRLIGDMYKLIDLIGRWIANKYKVDYVIFEGGKRTSGRMQGTVPQPIQMFPRIKKQ